MRAIFSNKASNIRSEPFTILRVAELTASQFEYFCRNPLDTYGFIDDFKDDSFFDESGVARCILVLEEGKDDGILLVAEGYEYARYTSYLPCARQIAMLQKYPSLGRYAQNIANVVDHYASLAVDTQTDGECPIKESSVANRFDELDEAVNMRLFLDMMEDRPEIKDIRSSHMGWYTATISEDYIKQKPPLREISQDEADIMCAKHTLWSLGVDGGVQADFSNCLLKDISLSNRRLNNAIFDGASIEDVSMHNTELCYSSFVGTHILDSDMSDASAEECNFRNATIRDSYIADAFFTHSNFAWVKFIDTNACDANFTNCCLEGVDPSGTHGIDMADESLSYNEEHWLQEAQNDNIRMEETQ